MLRRVGLSIAILFCLATVATATPTVVVGNYSVGVGQNLVVQLNVTGNDPLNGLTFVTDVNNNVAGGPLITGLDLTTGTIFASNQQPPVYNNPPPATKVKGSFLTQSGTVNGNGLIATLTIAAGTTPGVYNFRITGMSAAGGGSTTAFPGFANTAVSLTNGSITVVPEPATLVLGLFAAAGLGAVAIRRRRMQRVA